MTRSYEITKTGVYPAKLFSEFPFFFDNLRREQDLQRQLSLTKNQLRDLRVSNENNQAKLFDHSQRQGIPASIIIVKL